MDNRTAKFVSHGVLLVGFGLSAACGGSGSPTPADSGLADSAPETVLVQEKDHWQEGSCSEPVVPDIAPPATTTAPPPMMVPSGSQTPNPQPGVQQKNSSIEIACGAPFDKFLLPNCEARWTVFRMPEITCGGDGGRAWLNLRPTRYVETESLTLLIVGAGQEGSSYEGELRIGDEHRLLAVEAGALAFLQPLPQEGDLVLDGHVLQLTAKSAPGPNCVACRIHLGSIITH